ncbi:hypothetical protein SHIRM173S_06336 [Streptomyces hirsutus]
MSVTITRGTARVFFSRRRKKRRAAAVSRRLCTRMSRTLPSASTARHRYVSSPLILTNTSFRCHLSPGRGRRRRSPFAQACPNLAHHRRTVSWKTITPRCSISSSTSRKPSGKRKYSHTQGEITSAGYRCPFYDGGALSTDGSPPP